MADLRARADRRLAASRLLTPSALGLALICFLFGFLAVSCETPGGYGHTGQGATTTYTGLDLAVGTSPTVDAQHVRPELADRTDELGWHPAILLAALAIAVGMVAGAGRFGLRRRVVVAATAAAIVLLAVGELLARERLVDQVADQVRRPLPAGHTAADYVSVDGGFTGALVLTGTVLACFVAGYLRRRSAARPDRTT